MMMNKYLFFTILASAIIIAANINVSGQNGRYKAGSLGGSGIYILDTRTGDVRTCISAKLLQDDECWTLKEMQGR